MRNPRGAPTLPDAAATPIAAETGRRRHRLLSAPIDSVSPAEAADACAAWCASRDGLTRNVVTLNAKTVVAMEEVLPLRAAVEEAALVVADGVSISIAARILGVPLPGRVPGIDLMTRLLQAADRDGRRCYFLGARPEVIDALPGVLSARYPGMKIAGAHHGYFHRSETPRIVNLIRESGAELLFVAFGQPEAEIWCHHHGRDTGAALTMSVGGSFDVLSGAVRRSPVWMQKLGIEWLWRFLLEPRKRFRVIFVDNPSFLFLVLGEYLRLRRSRRG